MFTAMFRLFFKSPFVPFEYLSTHDGTGDERGVDHVTIRFNSSVLDLSTVCKFTRKITKEKHATAVSRPSSALEFWASTCDPLNSSRLPTRTLSSPSGVHVLFPPELFQ
jgi:hypothetical protein